MGLKPKPLLIILGPASISNLLAEGAKGLEVEVLIHSDWVAEGGPNRLGAALPALADPAASEKLSLALQTLADAFPSREIWLHPGVSRWSERSELLTRAEQQGFRVIAPPAKVISLFANKLNLLLEAEKIGIPNLVLQADPILGVREIERLIREFQAKAKVSAFPFVLKSMRGESNVRLQVIFSEKDVQQKLPLWLEQLRRSSGETMLFAERYVEGARHVVAPFVRFANGRFEAFPLVDVSLQSRFRKIIEVCPALDDSDGVRAKINGWTEQLAHHTNYVGVGVLEYFVDGDRVMLVEGAARLNTEFHIWEKVAGTRALGWQLESLDLLPVGRTPGQPAVNFAMSLRLYAEDPILQLPRPGIVNELDQDAWKSVRGAKDFAELHLSVKQGQRIHPDDYGMVGSIWVGGKDRASALQLARRVLEKLWIAGELQTNQRFLHELLGHPWVQEGIFHASFVDEEFVPALLPDAPLLKLFTAVCAAHPKTGLDVGVRYGVGTKAATPTSEEIASIPWVGAPRFSEVQGWPSVSGTLKVGSETQRVLATPIARDRWQVRLGLWNLVVRRVPPADGAAAPKPLALASLVAGTVYSLRFRPGSRVPAHETLVIVESLGVLVPHALPVEVKLLEWSALPDEEVALGQVLGTFEKTS